MKAVVINKHGGRDVLEYTDIETPKPKANEVLVKIHACALNHLDIWLRKGLPGLKLDFPHILGSDIAGEVADFGELVTDLKKGEKVLLNTNTSCEHCEHCLSGNDVLCRQYSILGTVKNGGYAEYISVSRQNILPFPKDLSMAEAASIPLTFLTAWNMLVNRAKIKPGETVLVLAAGSGVGSAAVQIAKLFNTTVIATASTEKKLKLAKALGADHLINYEKTDFSKEVQKLTNKKGVDVVFEHVGKATWEKSMLSVREEGRIVTCGATTGFDPITDLRHVFYRQIQILGNKMGPKASLFEILRFFDQKKLKPVVDRTLPLKDAQEAHRVMEDREQFGKIVLEMK
ncbi:zinc-binding dehydrogenase [Bdellovibrionota bacterium]